MSGDNGSVANQDPAVTTAEEVATDNTNVLNLIPGISIADIAKSGLAVLREGLLQPSIGLEHAARLTQENIRILFGKSELAPDPKDRRCVHSAFAEQPIYRRVPQGWLALQNSLQGRSDDISTKGQDRSGYLLISQ